MKKIYITMLVMLGIISQNISAGAQLGLYTSYIGIAEDLDSVSTKADKDPGYLISGFALVSFNIGMTNLSFGPVLEFGSQSPSLPANVTKTTDSIFRIGLTAKLELNLPVVSPYFRFQLAHHSNKEEGSTLSGSNLIELSLTASGASYDYLLGIDINLSQKINLFLEGGVTKGSITLVTSNATINNIKVTIANETGSINGTRFGGGVVFKL